MRVFSPLALFKRILNHFHPLSFIQGNEHVEMNNFSCSLSCTWVTIIDVSGRGSAISFAKKGNQVLFIICKRVNRLFEPRKRACIS